MVIPSLHHFCCERFPRSTVLSKSGGNCTPSCRVSFSHRAAQNIPWLLDLLTQTLHLWPPSPAPPFPESGSHPSVLRICAFSICFFHVECTWEHVVFVFLCLSYLVEGSQGLCFYVCLLGIMLQWRWECICFFKVLFLCSPNQYSVEPLLGRVVVVFISQGPPYRLSQWLHPFPFPPTVHRFPLSVHPWPHLVSVSGTIAVATHVRW